MTNINLTSLVLCFFVSYINGRKGSKKQKEVLQHPIDVTSVKCAGLEVKVTYAVQGVDETP